MICNAGIIDLGDYSVVFDTGLTPRAGEDIRLAARALTGKEPSLVVNSHHHNDHIRGNQAFREALFVSTLRNQHLINTKGRADLKDDGAVAAQSIEDLKKLVQSENKEERQYATLFLPYWEGIVTTLPETEICPPHLGFEEELDLFGKKRMAKLISLGGGHSESDCIMFLPDEKILFLGDLLFTKCHPFLAGGNPQESIRTLKHLQTFDAQQLVPGHGATGDKSDLTAMIEYIETLTDMARGVRRRGGTIKDAIIQPVPDRFAGWTMARPFFQANMSFLYSRSEP